jgi:nitrogen fixation protein FixH
MTAMTTRKLTGRQVIVWLAGTFAIVVGVNAYFIAKAITTYPGEDQANPYLQGIHYNRVLAEREQQKKSGWTAVIAGDRGNSGNTTITVTLSTQGTPLPSDLRIKGVLRHPADAELDKPLTFTRLSSNNFVSQVKGVARGAWDSNVQVQSGNVVLFEAGRRLWFR